MRKILKPSSRSRDTLTFSQPFINKGKTGFLNFQKTVLVKNTYNFKDVYQNPYYKVDYVYEVELLVLNDLRGKNSVVNTDGFRMFVTNELEKMHKKTYDVDINIRDLYSIDIHTKGKSKDDITRFYILNDLILSTSNRITGRVTKREIVYKKDKIKSIIAIMISKRGYLKLFMSDMVEQIDIDKKFFTILPASSRTLNKCFKILLDDDLEYAKIIVQKYLEKIFGEILKNKSI